MSDLPVRIYTPEPLLQHPLKMLRELARDIRAGRELAWRLFIRDLSAMYRQTCLGFVWAVLPPLVASVTFIFLQSQGIVQIPGTGIPYPAFAMIGTLLWQVFIEALQSPSSALTSAKPMLAKINFPREAILMAGLYTVVFNFLIRLLLVAGVMTWWKLLPGSGLLMFIPAMLGIMLCGFACGLAVAPLGALYGDVGRAIPIFAQFWMLLTPVVYPARTEGMAGWLARWNPASPLIVTAREALLNQPFTHLGPFLLVTALGLLALLLGLVAFRVAMPHLIARMGG